MAEAANRGIMTNNKNILFLCKGQYRLLFPEIARAMVEENGCHASAVAFNSPSARSLEQSRAFDRVHNLAEYIRTNIDHYDVEVASDALEQLEKGFSANFSRMLYADRIVGHYPFARALSVLACVADFWRELFMESRPDAILGEVACAAEWIAWEIANHLGSQYLIPYPTPVSGRLYFLRSPAGMWEPLLRRYQSKGTLSADETTAAEEFLRKFRGAKSKPAYLTASLSSPLRVWRPQQLMQRLRRTSYRVGVWREDGYSEVGSYDGTPPWSGVLNDAFSGIRHYFAEACALDRKITPGPKMYFPLHVQPEFTTEVRAPFYNNQIALIENIAKCIPAGYRLIVKEHPGMKGQRPPAYYRHLRRLYNVQLVSPSVDSHELIQASDLIFTITGTVAWEAAIYEKPVIAFGPLCYGFYEQIARCADLSGLAVQIRELLARYKPNRESLLRLIDSFFKTAHEVQWNDALLMPSILTAENIAGAARALAREIAMDEDLRASA